MNLKLESSLEYLRNLANKKNITSEDTNRVYEILNLYFSEFKRNQVFKNVEYNLSTRFEELLSHTDKEGGILFSNLYFLFCFTLSSNSFKEMQIPIYKNIAIPFKEWASKNWSFIENSLSKITFNQEIVFICRRAVTKGLYAPGSSIFTFTKALVNDYKDVTVISLNEVDETFLKLEDENNNLKIIQLEPNSIGVKLLSLIELLKFLKPKVILTEIEFDITSLISIIRPEIPIIYLSPGFYNLPWYKKIGLTDTLSDNPIETRKNDFFEIPTYVASELLNPDIKKADLDRVKIELGIKENHFVIGSIARMEKFSKSFLHFLKNLLNKQKNLKLILAGPNDQNLVYSELDYYIKQKRAIILGNIDAHLIGNCFNLGIDTFPLHSGFSVMELMEKGIPVISKNDEGIDGNWKKRVPELLCNTEEEMESLIYDISESTNYYDELSTKTKGFLNIKNYDQIFLSQLNKVMDKI